MKNTRLEDVYCVPKTEDEWKLLISGLEYSVKEDSDFACIDIDGTPLILDKDFLKDPDFGHYFDGRKQIPVDQFLDLLNDKITPWRLEEVGFKSPLKWRHDLIIQSEFNGRVVTRVVGYNDGIVTLEHEELNITTFTELIQQMKFLGWKNEEQ